MSKKEPKVAIVHDWLVGYAGGDRVVAVSYTHLTLPTTERV